MKRQHALSRAVRRGILGAIGVSLFAVSGASAATYPVAGGNGFSGSTEGWTGLAASCNQPLLCSASNNYAATEGNPPGSIESRTDITVNGGQLFEGNATWRSPAFVAGTVGGGTLEYDRQLSAPGLAAVEPAVTVEEVLVDETSGKSKSLGVEQVALADSVFRGRTVTVKSGTLSAGDKYHIELRSRMTTNSAQVGPTGSIIVRFDNVNMTLADKGPGGSSGTGGVTFPGPPIGDSKFRKIVKRTNWAAEKGTQPGGGVVPLADCTIIGTPKADVIRGSSGNDVICGLGGNDKIVGATGKDLIDGGSGNDRLVGSGGADVLAGLAGKDKLTGSSKGDRIGGGAKGDRIAGNGGKDHIKAGGGADRISGGASRDRISGGPGRDRAVNSAHDRLSGVERHS
jgi:Ca2+-binding RTX toxin-like protein